jgi:hypothetical protein
MTHVSEEDNDAGYCEIPATAERRPPRQFREFGLKEAQARINFLPAAVTPRAQQSQNASGDSITALPPCGAVREHPPERLVVLPVQAG